MGRDLKKTLPNPECELFYPEELCYVLKKKKKMVLWEKT